MREYAQDNGLTHRSLFTPNDAPRRAPQQFDMDANNLTTVEAFGNDEFYDTEENTGFTRGELEGVLQRAEEARQGNLQSIVEAHQQQIEQEQEQGEGVLRSLARGTLRVGGNIAGNLASGQDLTTSAVSGVAQPALQALSGAVMRRILPQQRPLLDLDNPRPPLGEYTVYPPEAHLQPHQPNVGATQQALPPATSNQPPTPNVQVGGSSSSSSGNAPQPQAKAQPQPQTEETERKGSRKTKKKGLRSKKKKHRHLH